MKLCLRKWLGRDLPVFCVSARKALLARTSGIGKEDLLKQSAIQPLEAHISAILQESAGRIDRTGNTVRMGQILLAQAQKYLLDKSQTLAALGSVLQKIAGLVQEQKTRSWEACLLSLKPLDKVLQRVGQEIPAALNPAQSGWRTALQPSSMTAGKAAALTWHQDARAALNHHTVAVEKIMRQDLVKLWKQTQGPLTKALGHAPKPATEGELEPESLRADHHQLLADLRSEESWGQASRLQLEIRRRRFLFASMLGGLGLVLAAVGAFQAWWALVALVVLLLGLGPWIALRAQQNYVKNFPLKLQECSAT